MTPSKTSIEIGSARAWLIWCLAALAFGYAFFQRVAPGVMVSDLMSDFSIGAAILGTLSALYFYPYVLMQIPLGVLIDRWGPRVLLTSALSVAGIGSFLFAGSNTIELAYVGRLLIGIGSAVGFLGTLAIAAKWFPPHRFAFLAGLVMFFGMMSGVFAQGPLAAFVDVNGWRTSMWSLGFVGIALAALIFLFVRDAPEIEKRQSAPKENWSAMGRSLKKAITDFNVWKVAIVASTMSGPMLTLGALWGTPYFQTAYELERTHAASLVSVLLIGWAFGAPFAGWLSDRVRKRKSLLVIGSFVLVISVACLTLIGNLALWMSVGLFALIGASGAFMTICFALVREISAPEISTSVTGIVNSMTVASGAVLQPGVGYVLDRIWDGQTFNGAPVYAASDFQAGFLLILAACVIGFLVSLGLKDSPLWDGDENSILRS